MPVTSVVGQRFFLGTNSPRLTVGSVVGATLGVGTSGELSGAGGGLGNWLEVSSGIGVEAGGIAKFAGGIW